MALPAAGQRKSCLVDSGAVVGGRLADSAGSGLNDSVVAAGARQILAVGQPAAVSSAVAVLAVPG